VLTALKAISLLLKDEKCHFNQTSLQFLGHTISAQDLLPDKNHLRAITEAPAPSSTTILSPGAHSVVCKVCANLCTVSLVEPMRKCLCDDIQWTAAQSSFEMVKTRIVNSSAMSVFDPSLPTVVHKIMLPTVSLICPSLQKRMPVTEPDLVALLDTGLKAHSVTKFTVACKACPELTTLRAQIKRGGLKQQSPSLHCSKSTLPPEMNCQSKM